MYKTAVLLLALAATPALAQQDSASCRDELYKNPQFYAMPGAMRDALRQRCAYLPSKGELMMQEIRIKEIKEKQAREAKEAEEKAAREAKEAQEKEARDKEARE